VQFTIIVANRTPSCKIAQQRRRCDTHTSAIHYRWRRYPAPSENRADSIIASIVAHFDISRPTPVTADDSLSAPAPTARRRRNQQPGDRLDRQPAGAAARLRCMSRERAVVSREDIIDRRTG